MVRKIRAKLELQLRAGASAAERSTYDRARGNREVQSPLAPRCQGGPPDRTLTLFARPWPHCQSPSDISDKSGADLIVFHGSRLED